ncbi:Uncharacterised protein [Mycobacterium tuberculosis]|nr:Uncharacterised protein [Mycobacterium tuberculosis]
MDGFALADLDLKERKEGRFTSTDRIEYLDKS